MEEKKLNIYEKMLKATEKIGYVAKNLNVTMGKSGNYKAVSEVDILNAVKPIEIELGIYSYPFDRKVIDTNVLITTSTYNGDTRESKQLFIRLETTYRFVNIDKPDEFIDMISYGDGVDSQDKAPGKAMTYADKYALMKAYKIQTGDDPDKDGSQELKKVEPKTISLATTEQKIIIMDKYKIEDIEKMLAYYKIKTIDELTMAQASTVIKHSKDKS